MYNFIIIPILIMYHSLVLVLVHLMLDSSEAKLILQ